MSWWQWLLIALGALVLVWAGFVALLYATGCHAEARELATFIPDCIVLVHRLLHDPRVPRRRKLLLVGLIGYLALPFDIVPDFIPVAGQLDDVIIVVLVLRQVLRGGEALIREHWPGPEASLRIVLRAVGGTAGRPETE
jgi:uncharacterized membrane protein YkvA (DUF1232 family)